LLADTLSNGTRGTTALEDRGHFALASRVLTQSDVFIVPRVDPASGQPVTYRLEPFVPSVSHGLEAPVPPSVPLLPFRFPSGSLPVVIQGPDGTIRVLGPAPFVQNRMRSLANVFGTLLEGPSPHITELHQLSTMNSQFEVQFTQYGRHVITLDGGIQDVW